MNILALDTSSQAASCAFLEGDLLLGEFFANGGLTHSQTILPMIDSLLSQVRRSMDDVDVLAVSHGPGSFTGLRIGLATAKGLAFQRNIPCVPVSTLESLAINCIQKKGLIVPAMDARRSQVYTSVFESDGQELTTLLPDSAIPIMELGAFLTDHPLGGNATLVGDGAHLVQHLLAESLPHLQLAPATLLHQRAGSIALAAIPKIREGKTLSPQELEPNYLRITQAERERNEKMQET